MDNLKSAIADKVLEISSLNEGDMKSKLEKINRFRDFVDACQTLITRYPAIETELERMVINNDFDTKIAASRVDTIIRLSEKQAQDNGDSQQKIADDVINKLEEIAESSFVVSDSQIEPSSSIEETEKISTDIVSTEHPPKKIEEGKSLPPETIRKDTSQNYIKEEKFLPEDIDYEVVEDTDTIDNEKKDQYIDFEEVSETIEPDLEESAVVEESEAISELNHEESNIHEEELLSDIEQEESKKETAKKVFKIIVIIAILTALVFLIIFIINNIKTILIILGVISVIALAIWWFFVRKKEDTE